MDIDEAILKLSKIKAESPIGGNTIVVLGFDKSGYNLMPVEDVTSSPEDQPNFAEGCVASVVVNLSVLQCEMEKQSGEKVEERIWQLDCEWKVVASVGVKAPTLDDAIDIATGPNFPLPEGGDYLEDSFNVNRQFSEDLNEQYGS